MFKAEFGVYLWDFLQQYDASFWLAIAFGRFVSWMLILHRLVGVVP